MKKIAIVIGTRPEVIKMAPVYLELKKTKKFKPILINTGQHKTMTSQMLSWFGIKEDFNLNVMKKNQSLHFLTALIIEKSTKVLEEVKPDLVMVQGDTASVMAVSIAAFYLKIPVAHVEAGLRTNDIYNPFPEEMSRRVVSRLATYHFAPTKLSITNLIREGISENIYLVGNTVIDALCYTTERLSKLPKKSPVLNAHLEPLKNIDFKNNRVILVTMHRRENWGVPHKNIAKTFLRLLNEFADCTLLFPVHKNPKVREVIMPILSKHKRVALTEPLDYVPFVYAMQNSYLILTDSGGVQEEAPALGKPVLVLRDTTERPEGISAGTAKLIGTNHENVYKEAGTLLKEKSIYRAMAKAKNPYGDGSSAKKIVDVLAAKF